MTDFADSPCTTQSDTDTLETDKTDYAGNADFLAAVLGMTVSDDCAVVVSFVGNTASFPKKAWYGTSWKQGNAALPENHNNNFSLAVFKDFGNTPTMVREAVNFSELSPARDTLFEVINYIAGEKDGINRPRLGHLIKRNAGRIVSGLRFEHASGSWSAEAWKAVESVSSVS